MFPAVEVLKKIIQRLSSIVLDPWKRSYVWWMARYCVAQRFTPFSLRLPNGILLQVADVTSFFAMYRSIFLQRIYDFQTSTRKPIIIDCGANIGLSVLFFKWLYPKSTVIAYEADKQIFSILQKNIESAGVKNIELHEQAVWKKNTKLSFLPDHADGGAIDEKIKSDVTVRAINFATELKKYSHIDFLKIDIEGAELEVLLHCRKELKRVHNLFFEFHSFSQQKQQLSDLLHILEQIGFRYHITSEYGLSSPFLPHRGTKMDMQLNIFAWKELV